MIKPKQLCSPYAPDYAEEIIKHNDEWTLWLKEQKCEF